MTTPAFTESLASRVHELKREREEYRRKALRERKRADAWKQRYEAETAKTAKVVPNYGMRPVGGYGIRGFRAHCANCGFLSNLYANVFTARRTAGSHKCATAEEATR